MTAHDPRPYLAGSSSEGGATITSMSPEILRQMRDFWKAMDSQAGYTPQSPLGHRLELARDLVISTFSQYPPTGSWTSATGGCRIFNPQFFGRLNQETQVGWHVVSSDLTADVVFNRVAYNKAAVHTFIAEVVDSDPTADEIIIDHTWGQFLYHRYLPDPWAQSFVGTRKQMESLMQSCATMLLPSMHFRINTPLDEHVFGGYEPINFAEIHYGYGAGQKTRRIWTPKEIEQTLNRI